MAISKKEVVALKAGRPGIGLLKFYNKGAEKEKSKMGTRPILLCGQSLSEKTGGY
jgi:hypothetical protein